MMWLTGSKKAFTPAPILVLGKVNTQLVRGFTLVEIMVALAVLSAGLVAVYKSLFTIMDSFEYMSSRIQAQCLVDNRIWEIENNLKSEPSPGKINVSQFEIKISPIVGMKNLNEIGIAFNWKEQGRQASIIRYGYLQKK